jgi:hypothetical protein
MNKGELIIQQLEALIDWNTCVAEQITKIAEEKGITKEPVEYSYSSEDEAREFLAQD